MYTIEDEVTVAELNSIDTMLTLAITWHTMRRYEKVLRRISKWGDDEPSVWARQALKEYEMRLNG
jgi:hypothetical protein